MRLFGPDGETIRCSGDMGFSREPVTLVTRFTPACDRIPQKENTMKKSPKPAAPKPGKKGKGC